MLGLFCSFSWFFFSLELFSRGSAHYFFIHYIYLNVKVLIRGDQPAVEHMELIITRLLTPSDWRCRWGRLNRSRLFQRSVQAFILKLNKKSVDLFMKRVIVEDWKFVWNRQTGHRRWSDERGRLCNGCYTTRLFTRTSRPVRKHTHDTDTHTHTHREKTHYTDTQQEKTQYRHITRKKTLYIPTARKNPQIQTHN